MAAALLLLAAAFLHWRQMEEEVERMNARLERAAAAQQALQRRLEKTQRLLEQQMTRLHEMEARQADEKPAPTREAQP